MEHISIVSKTKNLSSCTNKFLLQNFKKNAIIYLRHKKWFKNNKLYITNYIYFKKYEKDLKTPDKNKINVV